MRDVALWFIVGSLVFTIAGCGGKEIITLTTALIAVACVAIGSIIFVLIRG